MKKFLISAAAVGVFLLVLFYGITRYGFYIPLSEHEIHNSFAVQGKSFYVKSSDGVWEKFVIQGVDLTASMPEHTAHSYGATKRDYLRWMEKIQEMGANTIRVYQIMDDDFYNALYEFNMLREEPLYLLQGINVYDTVNYGAGDAYREEFLGNLLKDGRTVVDIIHGKRVVVNNTHGGSGNYFKDISDYVLGFLVGTEWGTDVIAYTNMQKAYSGQYQGDYFTTREDATPFEAMLAEVMDAMVRYESDKYGMQRPVGFINDPQNDPFEYADSYDRVFEKFEKPTDEVVTYARQLKKYNRLDAERVLVGEKNQAGCFAAYRLYDFCENFSEYLSEEQKETLAEVLSSIHKDRSYDGYLDLLGAYHTMPVIAAGFGMSTARGMVSGISQAPLTEQQQGAALLAVYDDMIAGGFAGGFISSWQDQWEKKSWNTAYAQDFENNYLWKDVQTEGQGYGLMEFNSNTCEIDGDIGEWKKEEEVVKAEGITLSARMDGEGLCLMLQGDHLSIDTPLYIPIDVTPNSGSKVFGENGRNLSFDREADFLLCIQGENNTRLLAHARYESVRENFLSQITGENPFIEYPEKNEESFVPVHMVMKNMTMVAELNHDNMYLKYLPLWETGKLNYGNNNPESENYNSQADFCAGEGIEIRIPWAMLNFANPVHRLVHGDYYENYGVDFQEIKSLGLGIGYGKEKILMKDFVLKWQISNYEERLKQSYYLIQSSWR
ncbi:MAG: hypothetical protein K2M46_10105 [Lachnospiraceae bacterium]|nr:hypothetical protein [Lachnospiraceae bacterium]